ncbi:MAG: hypothetical protein K1X57_15950, partial [Gemmataceae bacterium]|nr:hypothetical protein [Gemmataceae bacterium]
MPATTTATEFVDVVRKSGLLTPERIDEAQKTMPADAAEHPKKAAEHFIKQGLLTPFQAGLLINGKWRGFQIAGGKYKLLQLLGIGGMGKVYLCEHIRMKRL